MKKSFSFAAAAFMLGALFALASCHGDKPEPNPNPNPNPDPQEQKEVVISPQSIDLQVGDTLQLTAELQTLRAIAPDSLHWEVSDTTLATVSKEGLFTALKAGTGTVTAVIGELSDQVPFTIKEGTETFFMPYLRIMDPKDKILEYEASLGHKLVAEDKEMGILTFETNSELIPQLSYLLGQAVSMYAAPEVLQSKAFIDYMASQGFTTTGELLYDYYMEYTSPYETVAAAAVAAPIPDMEDYPTSMDFTLVNPKLEAIPYPNLNWNATQDEVTKFETARGYKQNGDPRIDEKQRTELIFTTRAEKKEYTEMFITRYLFDKDGKLLKASLTTIPAQYILTPAGDMIKLTEDFVALYQKEGYTEEAINEADQPAYSVYKNEAKDNKFTVITWNLKIDGVAYQGAGLEFVPFNGPNEIQRPLGRAPRFLNLR